MIATCLITAIITTAIIINYVLWFLYRRDLQQQILSLGIANRNLHRYIEELEQRCERYKAAGKIIEISEHPVVRVHPINSAIITTYDN